MAYAQALVDWADVGGYEHETLWDVVHRRGPRRALRPGAVARRHAPCPAASRSGWSWRRCCAVRTRCCCSTSRTTTSTCRPSAGSRSSCVTSPKTVLFVSHDRELLARAATRIATLEPGAAGSSVWVHPGRFATYHAGPRGPQRPARGAAAALGRGARQAQGAGAMLKVEGGLQRRHGLALPGRPDPAAQVRGGRTAGGGAAAPERADAADRRAHRQAGRRLRRPRADRADEAVRPRGLVRRAGGGAGLQRLGQVALPAAARRRRHRPRPRAPAGGRRRAGAGARTPARPARLPRAARAGSRRPTTIPSCIGRTLLEILHRGDEHRAGMGRSRRRGSLDRYGLARAGEQTFETLSGGQQARLQILLLELSGATLLLLDEPTDNLDLHSAEALEDAARGLRGHRPRGHPRPVVRARLRPVPRLRRGRPGLRVATSRSGTRAGSRAPADRTPRRRGLQTGNVGFLEFGRLVAGHSIRASESPRQQRRCPCVVLASSPAALPARPSPSRPAIALAPVAATGRRPPRHPGRLAAVRARLPRRLATRLCRHRPDPGRRHHAYSQVFAVPAGSYEFKVAINDSWDESYGAGGVTAGQHPAGAAGPGQLEFTYDDVTHRSASPRRPRRAATAGGPGARQRLAARPLTRERFYFVMADRFANGDTANDTGGLTGGRLETGFDPTDKGFYHGGDLAGLTQQARLHQGSRHHGDLADAVLQEPARAGHRRRRQRRLPRLLGHRLHPDRPAPRHQRRAEDAHRRGPRQGMKVFFDIITNHTADVIDYSEGSYAYIDKATSPTTTPTARPSTTRRTPSSRPSRRWTRRPRSPTPRSSHPGDRPQGSGLAQRPDDLPQPRRLDLCRRVHHVRRLLRPRRPVDRAARRRGRAWTDIYKNWVDFGIDGFRIDTVKHVNIEFWQKFSPGVLAEAEHDGKHDFFMFGEVYDARPGVHVASTRRPASWTPRSTSASRPRPSTSRRATPPRAARPLRGRRLLHRPRLQRLRAADLPRQPRHGPRRHMLKDTTRDADLRAGTSSPTTLMFLTRGQPVVYYGDEQGFIGAGGDKDARQDMFATQVAAVHRPSPARRTPSGSIDRFDTDAPLYQHIAALSALREANPALADGAQIQRYASSGAGIYAFSPGRPGSGSSTSSRSTTRPTAEDRDLRDLPPTPALHADLRRPTPRCGRPRTAGSRSPSRAVGRRLEGHSADRQAQSAPAVYLTTPERRRRRRRARPRSAPPPGEPFAEVTLRLAGRSGTTTGPPLGTDDNAPYRVFPRRHGIAEGTLLEYRAVARTPRDTSRRLDVRPSSATQGRRSAVAVASARSPSPTTCASPATTTPRWAAPGDWQPACEQAQLTLDPRTDLEGHVHAPGRPTSTRRRSTGSWDVNYGAGGVAERRQHRLHRARRHRSLLLRPAHPLVHQSTPQGPIVTAPGTLPERARLPGRLGAGLPAAWLQDPDGDGTYTWQHRPDPGRRLRDQGRPRTSAGTRTTAKAVGPGGANISFNGPRRTVVTFSYDARHPRADRRRSRTAPRPTGSQQAHLDRRQDRSPWPAAWARRASTRRLPSGGLHWSPTGGLRRGRRGGHRRRRVPS